MSSVLVFAAHSVIPSTAKFSGPSDEITITLRPPQPANETLTYTYTVDFPTIIMDNTVPITFTASGTNVVLQNNKYIVEDITTTEIIKIKANVDYNEISIGKTYTGNIVVKNIINTQDTLNVPISFSSSFCEEGEKGTDLEITEIEISNSDGEDDEWSPLDQIEVKVEVSNEGDERVKDVTVEIGIYNAEGKNIIRDVENLDDEQVDLGNIDDGDEETATFTFNVPSDFESGDYNLVVKVFSDDLGEDVMCTSESSDLDNDFYQTITGERESEEEKHVIFQDIKVTPSPAQCGDRIQISGEAANIGDEEYEDQVKVTLVNKELGLNLEQVIREDFDEGDSELVDFEFDVPMNTKEKVYVLEFKTHYDYDKNDDEYDITSEDSFTQSVRVEGGCEAEQPTNNVIISAELDEETPEAVAGKQVLINVNVRNTGTNESTFTIGVSNNEDWSQVVSINPQTLSIGPGQSKDAVIILEVNEDVEGDQEFSIVTTYEGGRKEQRVSVPVSQEPQQTDQLSPVLEHIRDNWFIYLIILVNIILIIAIILVIRSMVSPAHAM